MLQTLLMAGMDPVTTIFQSTFDTIVNVIQLRHVILILILIGWFLKYFALDNRTDVSSNTQDDSLSTKATVQPQEETFSDTKENIALRDKISLVAHTPESVKPEFVISPDISELDSLDESQNVNFFLPTENLRTDACMGEREIEDNLMMNRELEINLNEDDESKCKNANIPIFGDVGRDECDVTMSTSRGARLEALLTPRLGRCCSCRTSAKSASWSEADAKNRLKETGGDNKPIAVSYYYGKLIQVTSSSQVQIGDYNTMELNLSSSSDNLCNDDVTENSDEEVDERDLMQQKAEACVLRCRECRARLTDDEKSRLRPFDEAFPGPLTCTKSADNLSMTSQRTDAMTSPFDQSSFDGKHEELSLDDDRGPLSSEDDGDEEEEEEDVNGRGGVRSRKRTLTAPATDAEREQLFVEARIKIYNAAQEHRRHTNLEQDNHHKRTLKNILLKGRKTSSP